MPTKSSLPQWIPAQLVEKAPSRAQWLHEIKLDGFRMAARIERGQATLLSRTGLDWTARYPGMSTALGAVRAKAAYLDGELCGVVADGLPSFAEMQAATDGAGGVRLVFYAFDLLHLEGRDTARLPLTERKALLQPIVTDIRGLQFNGHETGDGDSSASTPASSVWRASCQRRPTRPMRPAIVACGAKQNASTARIRGGRVDRSGRIAPASRRAFARLLHGRRQAHLCRPRRHGHEREGAQKSTPAPRSAEAGKVAVERAAAPSTRFGSPLVLSHGMCCKDA
jgi:ATP dependent DNA ligase domain